MESLNIAVAETAESMKCGGPPVSTSDWQLKILVILSNPGFHFAFFEFEMWVRCLGHWVLERIQVNSTKPLFSPTFVLHALDIDNGPKTRGKVRTRVGTYKREHWLTI